MISRNVPRLRFKDFEDEWKKEKLGNVSDVTKLAGFEFSKYVTYKSSGNIIALRGLNIKNDSLDLSDVKYIDGSNFDKLSRSKLFSGDILYTYVGTVGNSAIINENDKYYLAPNVALIRINNSDIYNRFIQKEISTSRFFKKIVYPLAASSSQLALSMKSIRQFLISFPEISEQQHIGNFFSKLDYLIDLHLQKLEQLKKLKRGYLQKMFPQKGETIPRLRFSGFSGEWKKKKLGEIAEIGDGLHGTPSYSNNGDYCFINGNNLKNNTIVENDNNKFVNEDQLSNADLNLNHNSILIALNGTIGNMALYNNEKIKMSKSTGYINMITSNRLYILYYLNSTKIQRYFWRNITGTTIKNLGLSTLNNTELLLPDIDEQQKISKFFTEMDYLIEKFSNKVDVLKQQKKAYLQKMFI